MGCVRLASITIRVHNLDDQGGRKTTRLSSAPKTVLSNQSTRKSISDSSIAESTATSVRSYIQQIVQLHWSSSFYLNRLVNSCTSQHLLFYLLGNLPSTIVRAPPLLPFGLQETNLEYTHSPAKSTHSLRFCSGKLFDSSVKTRARYEFEHRRTKEI